MTRDQVIRAWKDERYRRGLTAAELSALPENPAGVIELSEGEMVQVGGQTDSTTLLVAVQISLLLCIPSMVCPATFTPGAYCV